MASSSSRSGAGPSKMPTEAMCMWLTSFSMCRNDASSGLKRSMWPDPPGIDGRHKRRYHDATPGVEAGKQPAPAPSGGRPLLGDHRLRPLQGASEHLGDVGNQVEGELGPHGFGDVVEVGPVARREHYLPKARSVRGQHLLLHA